MPVDAVFPDRGRRQLVAFSLTAIALFVMVGYAAWLRDGGNIPVSLVTRPLVVVVLATLAYQGHRTARNVLVAWLAVIGALYLVTAIGSFADAPLGTGVLGGAALGLLLTAWRLLTSRHVDAYLEARRPSSGG